MREFINKIELLRARGFTFMKINFDSGHKFSLNVLCIWCIARDPFLLHIQACREYATQCHYHRNLSAISIYALVAPHPLFWFECLCEWFEQLPCNYFHLNLQFLAGVFGPFFSWSFLGFLFARSLFYESDIEFDNSISIPLTSLILYRSFSHWAELSMDVPLSCWCCYSL